MSIFTELVKFRTNDFQNRGGNSPKSYIPVSLDVYEEDFVIVECLFKSTSEADALSWLTNFLTSKGYTVERYESEQDGEYTDDWVVALAYL